MEPNDDKIEAICQAYPDGQNNGQRENTKQDGKKKKGSIVKSLRKSFRRLSCVSKNAEDKREKVSQGQRPYEKPPNEVKINNNHHQPPSAIAHQQRTTQQEPNMEEQPGQHHQSGYQGQQQMGQERLPPLATSEDLYDHSANRRTSQSTAGNRYVQTTGNDGRYDNLIQKPVVAQQQSNHTSYIQQGYERMSSIYTETVSAQSYHLPAPLSYTYDQRLSNYGHLHEENNPTLYGHSNSMNYTTNTQPWYNQQWQTTASPRNVKIYLQTPNTKPQVTQNMIQSDFDNEYDFTHKKRGIAVIIIMKTFENNSQPARPLAVNDQRRMINLFSDLGFDVELIEDAKSKDLIDRLKAIRQRIATTDNDCDCFACVISSHGEEIPSSHIHKMKNVKLREHAISTYDGAVELSVIINLFNDGAKLDNRKLFKALNGKPKLFFIQACRAILGKSDEECILPSVSVEVDFDFPSNYNQQTSQPETPRSSENKNESNHGMASSSVTQLEPNPSYDLESKYNNAEVTKDNSPEQFISGGRIQEKSEVGTDTSCKMMDGNTSTNTESHMDVRHEFDPITNTYRIVPDDGTTSRSHHSIVYSGQGNSPVNPHTRSALQSPSPYGMQTNNRSGHSQATAMPFAYGGQHPTWNSYHNYNNEYPPTHPVTYNASQSGLPHHHTQPKKDLHFKLEESLKFMDELCSSPVKDPIAVPPFVTHTPKPLINKEQEDIVEYCNIPCGNDCLVMYTVPSGYIGWSTGDKDNVSIHDIAGWLPYCLYIILRSAWDNKDILEVLTEANYMMVQQLEALYQKRYYKSVAEIDHRLPKDVVICKSVAEIDHRLLKDVIFRPKKIL